LLTELICDKKIFKGRTKSRAVVNSYDGINVLGCLRKFVNSNRSFKVFLTCFDKPGVQDKKEVRVWFV
jgi:hypothetical protein